MSTTTSKGTGNTTEAGGRMTEKERIVESLGLLGKDRDELRECVIAMSHEAAMYKQERDALKASNAALVGALKVAEKGLRPYAKSLGGDNDDDQPPTPLRPNIAMQALDEIRAALASVKS